MSFECSICGVSGKERRLMESISLAEKGIVRACKSCVDKENLLVLRRPTTFELKKSEAKELDVSSELYKARVSKKGYFADREREESNKKLREIADRNYEKKIEISSYSDKDRSDLVDNFHWVIMMARRKRKITQEQLAREISESLAAIKMAEKGILPEDDYKLVRKIESFLRITLIKDESKRPNISQITRVPARILRFDPTVIDNLTIADLKKMKDEREKSLDSLSGFSEI